MADDGQQDILKGLNPRQREAVTAGDGPVLVLAGPGSGKTRVLTHRIAYLLYERGVYPSRILAVTFTNKAAGEMRERVERIRGGRLDGLLIGTFHSVCARLLRIEADATPYNRDYQIYDTDDQQSLMKTILRELDVDEKKYSPGRVLNAISNLKNELITPEQHRGRDYFGEIVARSYTRYQKALIANNALDFDDLLVQTYLLMRDNPTVREKYQTRFEYILVDEFQDTNTAQYQLVQLLSQPRKNVFVVGDEDQGIYAFRGADYRNVNQFRRDYPNAKVILLEQNYRSTQIVLDAARAVIDKNKNRTAKALFTERKGGALITLRESYNEADEGEYIIGQIARLRRDRGYNYNDFAIMFRTNAQSQPLETALVKFGVPYRLIGGVGFYKRREVRDLMAYLRVINNPNDTVSFNRIINVPGRGIGTKSVEAFNNWIARKGITQGEGLQSIASAISDFPLSGKAAKGFIEFATLIQDMRGLLAVGNELPILFDELTARIGFNLYINTISDSDNERDERHENIQQLRGILSDKRDLTLGDALTDMALVAEVDSIDNTEDRVVLLTMHAAKGLEFPVVFIAGIEDGILPHSRSFDDPESMAEERRLLYVGLTRAKDHLFLSFTFKRSLYGEAKESVPSRFLNDIPAALLEGAPTKVRSQQERAGYREATRWDRDDDDWGASQRTASAGSGSNSGSSSSKVIPFNGGAGRRDTSSSSSSSSRREPPPRPLPPMRFREGMRVKSPKYGVGTVVKVERASGDEMVTVQFDQHGKKPLLASFADLLIID